MCVYVCICMHMCTYVCICVYMRDLFRIIMKHAVLALADERTGLRKGSVVILALAESLLAWCCRARMCSHSASGLVLQSTGV